MCMDYFLVFTIVFLFVIGVYAVSRIGYIAKFSVLITVIAGILTALSLLHSSGRMVVYNVSMASSAFFAQNNVDALCGPKDPANTLCYQEVEHRGYPFRMITINYPPDTAPKVTLYQQGSRGRGFGPFLNYMLYLTIVASAAALIKKISLTSGSKH